jgi:phenylalanine ammonia-lyase
MSVDYFDRNGKPITIDGHTLSISAVTAAARFNAQVELTSSPTTRHNVKKSRAVIEEKIAAGTSVYGISTGFGGSGESLFSSVSRCQAG